MAQHNYEYLEPSDTPSTVPTTFQSSSDHTFNPGCAHNPMAIQCNQSQYPNLNHNFALPQFIAQHNCKDQEPNNTPIEEPTTPQVPSDHTFNLMCAHNMMRAQCNMCQYLTSLNKICTHNPSTSQVSQTNLSNSFVFPYPPDPGEHVLKRSSTSTGEQDFPVKWFQFIHQVLIQG